ncbi:hypothetical protein H0A73_12180 [Alcaligenaceae bacterium]|nr:hypothetical protein [Alcaligenaceae bacterium]
MMPPPPQPFLAVRLDAAQRPWRLPLTADLYVTLFNMPVAYAADAPGLPFSFAALPGRYLADLFLHGRAAVGRRPLVILNPASDLPPDALFAVAVTMQDTAFRGEATPAVRVLADLDGHVIAYVFNEAEAFPEAACFDLRFLSCFDAHLDAAVLQAAGVPADVGRVRMPVGFSPALALPRLQGIEAMALHVARRRLAMHVAGSRRLLAVATHHAGDIFLAMRVLAACDTRVDGVVVHRMYVDIVREVCPHLPCIIVDGPLPSRGDAVTLAHPLNDELLYLENHVLPVLPQDASIVLMRAQRDYIPADTTLSAQLAFAVGSAADVARFPGGRVLMLDPEGPLAAGEDGNGRDAGAVSPTQACAPATLRVPGRRVLLHFDGGWPLKVYPAAEQRELVDLLLARGFRVSVLGAPVRPDVPTHGFAGLAQFNTLLSEHDVLVGMDSFPCHYASQQRDMPVLCLFASTRVWNLAHDAPEYLAASRGLVCSPCGSRVACPRFGGTECRNFISPAAVVALLEAGLVDA